MPRVGSEQRRRELTLAAVQLIVEEGPAAVTFRKIADRAGASLGIVHYTFRDMDELIGLANAEVLSNSFQALRNVRTDLGVRGFISDLLHSYVQLICDQENETLAFFETFISLIRTGTANTAVAGGQQFFLDYLHEAEKHDSRPSNTPLPQLATIMTMVVDGLALIHLARRDPQQTTRDLDELITALQHLI